MSGRFGSVLPDNLGREGKRGKSSGSYAIFGSGQPPRVRRQDAYATFGWSRLRSKIVARKHSVEQAGFAREREGSVGILPASRCALTHRNCCGYEKRRSPTIKLYRKHDLPDRAFASLEPA
jgi:hypothetical protein